MLALIETFPQQIREASRFGITVNSFNNILVCGMGGSIIPGYILKDYIDDVPVYIAQGNIPKFINEKTLAFVITYSGKTEETIKMYKALKKKCQVIAITSDNSKLKAERVILIPKRMLPRLALAYLFFPMLNIINKKKDVKSVIRAVKKVNKNDAKKLASKLRNKTPIIYACSEEYRAVAYRWQTQFNENAKIIAHSGFFTEANHNEIEAKDFSKFYPILLNDGRKIKAKKIINMDEIKLKGSGKLAKMFYGIHFGDYVSYFLAKNRKVNPEKTPNIDKLKEK